jgi:hypothetical protein
VQKQASIPATLSSLPDQREVDSKDSAKTLTDYRIETARYQPLAK